ncbi:MAG: magnesium chelatase subunit D family protein [Methanotrichaceae archaeon]|nr:magnesium chelatase subunit D family protein [Methanotrichaceae archaeon]
MHHLKRRVLPFPSIVGQEDMKYALMLNAINPRIGGVLVRGEKGTAKSTAVRALAELLEEVDVVKGCPFNCNPHNPEEMCDICMANESSLSTMRRPTPVVDLPLGATEDRVVGSLDVERAIKEGIKALEPGILAAANRGILYIDEVNLLDDHVADVLLDSAAMGVNIVEREGVSVAHPAKFILVGTMNPEEGELRPQLLDRFGLQVNVDAIGDVDQRVLIVQTAEAFESDPHGFRDASLPAMEALRDKIRRAKALLPRVTMSDGLLRALAATCVDLGVKTHRAEIVIARTAKTIAAFEGRTEVTYEDVKLAMRLALPHRMRSRPFEPPTLKEDRLEKSLEQNRPEEPPKDGEDDKEKDADQREAEEKPHPEEEHDGEGGEDGGKVEGQSEGRDEAGQASRPDRGREEVFRVGDPIDVSRVDMPRERDKTARRKRSGRRMNSLAKNSSGRYLRHTLPRGGGDIAVDATIRAAAPYQIRRDGANAVNVSDQDIREKERVRMISAVLLFLVDASGSMGSIKRMESAKGAILSLLKDSYQKRDKIGMVAFKGEEAQTLLPPSCSVDLAMKCLEDLPTGGRTPLSAGLIKGLNMFRSEMKKDDEIRPILVLISDGRANVSQGGKIKEELMELAQEYRGLGVHTIVIDTEVVGRSSLDMRLGYCRDIAKASNGRYYPITSLTSARLVGIVDGEQRMLFSANALG